MPRATVVDMNRHRPLRAASIVIAATLGVGALAGCGPADPSPAPTPTGFASEEEAFAAAEATYRAYVDALNQVDLSDPSTFEEVYRWTTGDANAAERESLSGMHANGWTVSGTSEVTGFNPTSWDAGAGTIDGIACLRVADVTLTDRDGNSVVSTDRPDTQSVMIVASVSPDSPTGALLSVVDGSNSEQCG